MNCIVSTQGVIQLTLKRSNLLRAKGEAFRPYLSTQSICVLLALPGIVAYLDINMEEPKDPQQFREELIACLTNRETHYAKYFATIYAIEHMLNSAPEVLLHLIPDTLQNAKDLLVSRMRCTPLEALKLWLSTKIAKERLFYFKIGVLKTKRKGDSRESKLSTDRNDHLFALMKVASKQQRAEAEQFCLQEWAREDKKLPGRLKRLLKREPHSMEYLLPSHLQRFLMDNWIITHNDRPQRNVPPLCFCSDPTIVELAKMCGIRPKVTDKYVRKTWERLGLRKARRILFFDAYLEPVLRDGVRIQRLMMTDLRRRARP